MFGVVLGFTLSGLLFFILHVTGSGSFPRPLTAQEEKECLERFKNGDMTARNELIEHNLRLVAHIIKKYYANSNDQDDLISIGTIGLIKAVNTFDSSKGIRLSSYAARCIENAILTLWLKAVSSFTAKYGLRQTGVRTLLPFQKKKAASFPDDCFPIAVY